MNKWFTLFLAGSFFVSALLIALYRAIETKFHIFAFLFLGSFIVMCFCWFLLELMFLEFATHWVINLAHDSKLIFGVILLALIVNTLYVLPRATIRTIESISKERLSTNFNGCTQVFSKLHDSAKYVYDTKLLAKCEYTRPLSKIMPSHNHQIDENLHHWPSVVEEYMSLLAKNSAFVISLFVAMIGGTSFFALATLFFKNGTILILGFFSKTALEMLFSKPGKYKTSENKSLL